jgi:hypothetical protein
MHYHITYPGYFYLFLHTYVLAWLIQDHNNRLTRFLFHQIYQKLDRIHLLLSRIGNIEESLLDEIIILSDYL